jgi:hypothetical protein
MEIIYDYDTRRESNDNSAQPWGQHNYLVYSQSHSARCAKGAKSCARDACNFAANLMVAVDTVP